MSKIEKDRERAETLKMQIVVENDCFDEATVMIPALMDALQAVRDETIEAERKKMIRHLEYRIGCWDDKSNEWQMAYKKEDEAIIEGLKQWD